MARRNPPKHKGLPHQSPQLLEMASILEQQFDVTRTKLPEAEKFVPGSEILDTVLSKHNQLLELKKQQKEIQDLAKAVDFSRHIENLAHFKFDLEGFLGALQAQIQTGGEEDEANKIYRQYKVCYDYLKLLIDNLKRL